MRRRFSWWERVSRLIQHRLIVPLKRSPHPPEHSARGVGVGIFWAFTPVIGIQMYIVFACWLLTRRSDRFRFNLIIALAWTWVTNVFTMLPTFYVFYITGQILTFSGDIDLGYGSFVAEWETALANSEGFFGTVVAGSEVLFRSQGIPLTVGCLPYAIGLSWLGYRWTLRFVNRRRARLARRAERPVNLAIRKQARRAEDP